MNRRNFLLVVAGSFSAGCTSSEGEEMDGGGTESSRTTIASETLYTDTRYPEDLTAGDTLRFQVDVVKGGPVVVVVSSESADSVVFRKRADTQAEFEYEVEYDGTHMIQVANVDEVDFTVTKI